MAMPGPFLRGTHFRARVIRVRDWNSVAGRRLVRRTLMDDKTIDLWPQIEDCRRRGARRGLPAKAAAKPACNDN